MTRLVVWFERDGLVGRNIGGQIEIVRSDDQIGIDYIADRRVRLVAGVADQDMAAHRKLAESALCAHLIRQGRTSTLRMEEIRLGRAYVAAEPGLGA